MLNLLQTLVLLSSVGLNSEYLSENCSHVVTIKPGKQSIIFNSKYPEKYVRGSECQWVVDSDRPMTFSCDPFELPFSTNCELAALMIYDGFDKSGARYCGNRSISVITKTNKLVIKLTTSEYSPPGKFLCTLEGVEIPDDYRDCGCGRKNDVHHVPVSGDIVLQPSITGGEETGINEYPMMAGLFDSHLHRLFCGATIINKRQVITAAHCLNEKLITELKVLVGEHVWSTVIETNSTKLFPVESYTVHPLYDASTEDYDIAVVNVVDELTFNLQVGPACLPFQHFRSNFENGFVEILGWGSTEFAGGPSSTLQKVRVGVIKNRICSRNYTYLSSRQLCTDGAGKDSCQFDSGGPVLWQNPKSGRLVAVGIISLGGACGGGDPSVNTRVGAFMDWLIRETPTGIAYCTREYIARTRSRTIVGQHLYTAATIN